MPKCWSNDLVWFPLVSPNGKLHPYQATFSRISPLIEASFSCETLVLSSLPRGWQRTFLRAGKEDHGLQQYASCVSSASATERARYGAILKLHLQRRTTSVVSLNPVCIEPWMPDSWTITAATSSFTCGISSEPAAPLTTNRRVVLR